MHLEKARLWLGPRLVNHHCNFRRNFSPASSPSFMFKGFWWICQGLVCKCARSYAASSIFIHPIMNTMCAIGFQLQQYLQVNHEARNEHNLCICGIVINHVFFYQAKPCKKTEPHGRVASLASISNVSAGSSTSRSCGPQGCIFASHMPTIRKYSVGCCGDLDFS